MYLCEKQCSQCLFSKDRVVSAKRFKQIIEDCKKDDDFFLCHKGTIKGHRVICKGFYDNIDIPCLELFKKHPLLLEPINVENLRTLK